MRKPPEDRRLVCVIATSGSDRLPLEDSCVWGGNQPQAVLFQFRPQLHTQGNKISIMPAGKSWWACCAFICKRHTHFQYMCVVIPLHGPHFLSMPRVVIVQFVKKICNFNRQFHFLHVTARRSSSVIKSVTKIILSEMHCFIIFYRICNSSMISYFLFMTRGFDAERSCSVYSQLYHHNMSKPS